MLIRFGITLQIEWIYPLKGYFLEYLTRYKVLDVN